MNANTAKALVIDAYQQVVDNKIFRLLLILEAVIVLFFFLVGFRENEVRILWGVWTLPYADLMHSFGQRFTAGTDLQGILIQSVQSLVVEGLSGNLGMIICLSATAFFMPRMLEKGAADIVFSKPVSRLALMLSRYVSGILFVGILATVCVVGIWIALLVTSGYNDPGVLWGAPMLVFLFGMLHAFSILVGVVTRSTVAAILLSVVFFMGTGCVHNGWKVKEFLESNGQVEASLDDPQDEAAPTPLAESQETGGFLGLMLTVLDGLHLVLPKTSDVDVLTRKLRKTIEGEPWHLSDDTARVSIQRPPQGMELAAPAPGVVQVDLAAAPVVFTAPGGEARLELSRRARTIERPDPAHPGKVRTQKMNGQQAAEDVLTRAKAAGSPIVDGRAERVMAEGTVWYAVQWQAAEREHVVYVTTTGDWIVEAAFDAAEGWTPDGEGKLAQERSLARLRMRERFLRNVRNTRADQPVDPETWYPQRFRWDAPLPYNMLFSIASSLAFIVLMLALAAWKLRRIDF